jgi:hypothetical protein
VTAAADVDPTSHRPSHDRVSALCEFCGDLTTNPTRCPGWLGHRTRQFYRVEGWENSEWSMMSSARESVPEAQERLDALKRRFPELPMRIVAETTSYMVVRAEPGTAPLAEKPSAR